ncbi:MAG: polysaccharide biosynthesis/export family protein [Candidatus Magnetoovum sp. WYHC-5]|nr:polysaccharide biosynthesis/export family protein [Candidatus Magnetoovum sp. WYHC-5]
MFISACKTTEGKGSGDVVEIPLHNEGAVEGAHNSLVKDGSKGNPFYDVGGAASNNSTAMVIHDLFPYYQIAPGDILDILFQIDTATKKDDFKIEIDNTVTVKFVHAPELNETQVVRPDGYITLPIIGDVLVLGKTVQVFTEELKGKYAKVLVNPSLYVVVPEFRSRIRDLRQDLHTAPRGLSRLVTVRPDGYVTFPMVGEVFVANRTIKEVNEDINNRYGSIYSGLHVNLFLEKSQGFFVYVFGEVKKPGVYELKKPINIIEAITLAEGTLSSAKLSDILVIRKKSDKVIATKYDANKLVSLNKDAKMIMILPNDLVYVPKKMITELAELMRDISDITFFRGWSLGFSWELHREPSDTTTDTTTTPTTTTTGITTGVGGGE